MADLLGLKYANDVVTTVPNNKKWEDLDWTTFEGVTKKIKTLSLQHLCNIYYFVKYVNPEFCNNSTIRFIACEIDKRNDGQLLPYRPLRRFSGEIDFLKQKGWLFQKENKTLIIIDGELIGQVAEE